MSEVEDLTYAKQFERTKEVGEFWGKKMPRMAIEELAELQKEICKYERLCEDTHIDPCELNILKDNVVREMADVFISIGALMHNYDIRDWELLISIDTKLDRKYDTE